jgi:CheY-like chemotaxis protein
VITPDAITALILEDEPILGFALEDMLLDMGVKGVTLATTIVEAHAYLDGRTPHLAVLDVNIHGHRSYTVADRLVAAGIPFVFASGYGDAEHPEHLRNIPTMTKPYSDADLRQFVLEALGQTNPATATGR